MNKLIKPLALGTSVCLLYATPIVAQDEQSYVMEEIIITGRKREESLQDVPVSTSVLSSAALSDAGIDELNDLFTLIPGLHYDEDGDRLAALPSIRGVQANEISSNRTKVTAFVDGMPVLGSQGSIGFSSFQQVEVYRGPQSAAFGRSTFAGAINYISKDPTDEFEGSINVDVDDFGERVIGGSLSGPIIPDLLGYIVQLEHEDSGSPSRYHATGDVNQFTPGSNFGASDGTEYNSQTGDNFSAKLVFTPTENLTFDLAYGHVETHDQQNATFYLTEEARNACFEGNGIYIPNENGLMQGVFNTGVIDCDWDSNRPNFAQHDHLAYLEANPALLQNLVDQAVLDGAATGVFGGKTLTVEEQIKLVAQGYSVPDDHIGTRSERDRVTLQTDMLFDNGGALQLSLMYNEETQNRMTANTILYYDPDLVGIFQDNVVDGGSPGVGVEWNNDESRWEWLNGMGGPMTIAASPVEISENYVEARWVSPGEDRVRYVVGASFYDYDYLEENYANQDMNAFGLGYGAELYGIVPEFTDLVQLPFAPDESILSEQAVNTAAFFNVQYDFTDWMTLSAEGRYQEDKISAQGSVTDPTNSALRVETESRTVTTRSFLPRVALNFNINDDTSFYFQWAKGVNPAGINIDLLNPNVIETIENGVQASFIPFPDDPLDPRYVYIDADGNNVIDDFENGATPWEQALAELGNPEASVFNSSLNPETYLEYDEEELTNLEFGFKGNLFDGQVQYAGSIFTMKWENQIQTVSLDWDGPCANNTDDGRYNDGDTTSEEVVCIYEPGLTDPAFLTDRFHWVTPEGNASVNNIATNFGDVDIKGVELELTYNIDDNWSVRGSGAYLDATYDNFCDLESAEDALHIYYPELGLRVLEPEDNPNDAISTVCYESDGNEVAEQPKVTWSLSPTYRIDVLDGMRLQVRADVSYESRQWLTAQNYSQLPSVMIGNLSIGLSDENWSFTAYVENITDENSPTRITTGGDNTDGITGLGLSDAPTSLTDFANNPTDIGRSNFIYTPRRPRTMGLRATYNF